MPATETNPSAERPPLRLWPGVALAVLLLVVKYIVPLFTPDALAVTMLGGAVGGLAIGLWWLLFSRAPWFDRLGGTGLMIVGLVVAASLLDESLATAGMGMMFPFLAIPMLGLAIVVWAVLCGHLADGPRRATLALTILAACGAWTLLRIGGFSNQGDIDYGFRWAPTPEERLLATAADEPLVPAAPDVDIETKPDWPGFRGPGRNSIVASVRIDTNWAASPPVELWRRPVGPGWSSFAVHGDLIYTQEQRGDEEVVACYRADSGEPVWLHGDPTRFWEANAGAGPRGTPTLHAGRLYTFGGTGILNALDALDGSVLWSRDVAADTGVEVPYWGFASSPVVTGDLVIIAAAGQLAAYDLATGDPRWTGPDGGDGYSSPHLLTIADQPQVLLASISGVVSVDPADGTLLWKHAWPGSTRIVQPAITADGDLLVSRGGTTGIRRIRAGLEGDRWTTEERWTSIGLKPYFSDFVIHEGHAYGFDGNILSCIDIADGERRWKGGRYGGGQMLLLAGQDLLLVVSEQGELGLVEARPDGFVELARIPALEGKTWNHPVLVGDRLFVRNAEEMAAFRLALARD